MIGRQGVANETRRDSMVLVRESCRTGRSGGGRSAPAFWLLLAIAAALVVRRATAAAKSGRLDRLLPKDRLFAPKFAT